MFSAVLDTCVLYPMYLRDTLLRLGEAEFFKPLWSNEIVAELSHNLQEVVADPEKIDHLVDEMGRVFDDSLVEGYEALIPTMTCDQKDRHVLAVAVHAQSGMLVTFNVSDFPESSTDPYAIDVKTPDEFLLDQLDLSPFRVLRALQDQAAAYKDPEKTIHELLAILSRSGVPAFVEEVRRHLESGG